MERDAIRKYSRKHIVEEIVKSGSPRDVLVSSIDLPSPFRNLPNVANHKSREAILVNECGSHYELVAGRKKFFSLKEKGIRVHAAVVVNLSEEETCLFNLAAYRSQNQKDLLEMAASAKTLIEKHGVALKDVVELCGQSRSQVLNAMRLLELPQSVLLAYAGGYISYGHARALIGLQPGKAASLVQIIVDKKLSVRDLELMMGQENRRANKETDDKAELLKAHSGASSVFMAKDNSLVLNFDTPEERERFVDGYLKGKGVSFS